MLWTETGNTITVNGCSGRYGPADEHELYLAAVAFFESGYNVTYMGWDKGANRPFPFIGTLPILVKR
jgi:hypothetical protein